jgi:hypothetical protein
MSDPTATVKQLLKLQAQTLRTQADALDGAADALPDAGFDSDPLLNTCEIQARYNLGHEGVRAAAVRGELAVLCGARDQLMVFDSEMRRYFASRPFRPTPRRAAPPPDLDAWEADADRALHLVERRR